MSGGDQVRSVVTCNTRKPVKLNALTWSTWIAISSGQIRLGKCGRVCPRTISKFFQLELTSLWKFSEVDRPVIAQVRTRSHERAIWLIAPDRHRSSDRVGAIELLRAVAGRRRQIASACYRMWLVNFFPRLQLTSLVGSFASDDNDIGAAFYRFSHSHPPDFRSNCRTGMLNVEYLRSFLCPLN